MSQAAAPTVLDRLMASIRAIIRAELPQLTYAGVYEYLVQATDGTTVDASPADTSIPLPSITKVQMRPGIAGGVSKPAIGSKCLIGFINADPTRPYVIGYDSNTAQDVKIQASSIELAPSGPSVARVGDTVDAGYLVVTVSPTPGLVVSYFPGGTTGHAAAVAFAAAMTPNPGAVVSMTSGVITSGSSKVTSG